MSTLKGTLENLASQFAMSILNALRSASIEEVMSVTGGRAASAASAASGASAAAPAKRGPGRPKKVAAAAPAAEAPAAPKKRGRPAGSGKKAAAASAPAPAAAKPAKKTSTGRLARRSAEDIGGVVQSIVSLLESNPNGLRAEQIRGALGLDAKELPRPLADGLSAGTITKQGQKRATTYFAAGGKGKKRK
jgi:hypothetical protein